MAESPSDPRISREALLARLGAASFGASRDVDGVIALAAGEELVAVVAAAWRRRGWVVVATDAGLRLARRPRLFGRSAGHRFEWRDLTAVRSSALSLSLRFADVEVDLIGAAPHTELVRLLERARRELHGDARPSIKELHELAERKLGRLVARGFESIVEGLPDRLEAGEHVERLAGGRLDFDGLLVLTDRRLLLVSAALRRANERLWAVDRADVLTAEPVAEGLRLALRGGESTLVGFADPDRRDEFAVVLAARSPPAPGR